MWLAVLGDCVAAWGWLGTDGDIAAAISISQSPVLGVDGDGKMEKTGQGRGKKKLSRGCTKMDRGKNRRRGGKNVLFESSVLLRDPLD